MFLYFINVKYKYSISLTVDKKQINLIKHLQKSIFFRIIE